MKPGKTLTGASLWRGRAAFLAVSVVAAALLLFGVVAPLLDWALDDGDSLADRRALLARNEAVAAQENAVRDYVHQVKDSNARGDLLEGASAGIVTAALQSRLKAMGEAAGVTVLSIEALPLKTLGVSGQGPVSAPSHSGPAQSPQLVGARMAFTGTATATHNLTRAIETGPPLLLITSAVMTQPIGWRPPTEDQQPIIQAQFDVYGGSLATIRP